MSTNLKYLVLGATGATGKNALTASLASPSVSSVHSLGRRNPELPPTTPGLEKLHTGTIDFDALLKSDPEEVRKLKAVEADVVVIALGTTRAAAGGMPQFIKIDHDYVLAAAEAARVESKVQKLVYCSSGGASSSSYMPYLKSKGLTEEGLVSLGYSDTVIFRPGMLVVPGGRGEGRLAESILAKVTGVLSHFSSSLQIQTPVLGAAMVRAGIEGTAGLQKLGLGKKELLAGKEAWLLANRDSGLLGAMK